MNIDELTHDPAGPVLIVGGYGTVGAELTRAAAGEWPLLLTGRTPERAAALLAATGAQARRWDLGDPEPFRAAVRAVVAVVNDPDDRVLAAAVRGGVPYVDVARWTARLQRAVTRLALTPPVASPVLLSSAWMGGVVPLLAAHLAARVGGAQRVDTVIRYDLADRSGADSVEFMDRLGVDFEVVENGRSRVVAPLTGVDRVTIGPDRTRVARLDTPEQFTLPLTLGATTVRTRLGFSSTATGRALTGLGRAGFFRRARGERWEPLRRKLLHAPGDGGTARLRVDVHGPRGTATATVGDPEGQAHLTAVGALLGLRRVLGADGAPAPAGLAFPEQHPRPDTLPEALEAAGVRLTVATTGGPGASPAPGTDDSPGADGRPTVPAAT